MEDGGKDIFNIKLTAEGIGSLIRFCKLVRALFILSILVSLPVFIINILQLTGAHDFLINLPPLIRLQYQAQPYFWLLYILIWMGQIYYYWKFSRAIKKAIISLDEKKFNESFVQLYYNAGLIIIVVIISIINNWFNLFIQLKYPL